MFASLSVIERCRAAFATHRVDAWLSFHNAAMQQIGFTMKKHGLTDELIKDIRLAIPVKNWLIKHGVDDLMASIDDIANHGLGGGVTGFIYTTDLIEFIKQDGIFNTIRDMIEERADGTGETMISLASMMVRKGHFGKFELERYAAMVLVSPVDDIINDDYLLSCMVWWAVEQTAYQMADVKIDIDSATDEGSQDE